jgi:hypothetical protein
VTVQVESLVEPKATNSSAKKQKIELCRCISPLPPESVSIAHPYITRQFRREDDVLAGGLYDPNDVGFWERLPQPGDRV